MHVFLLQRQFVQTGKGDGRLSRNKDLVRFQFQSGNIVVEAQEGTSERAAVPRRTQRTPQKGSARASYLYHNTTPTDDLREERG